MLLKNYDNGIISPSAGAVSEPFPAVPLSARNLNSAVPFSVCIVPPIVDFRHKSKNVQFI